MDFFSVLDVVEVDNERSDADKTIAEQAAESARAQAVGAAIVAGQSVEDAQAEGDAVAELVGNNHRVWYEIDPDVMYPAAIAYLKQNGGELLTLSGKSEGELATLALDGNKTAAFCLRCRTYALNNLPIEAKVWDLALVAKDDMSDVTTNDWATIKLREKALEAARLFVTECIHQVTAQPIGVHIGKGSGRWKL